MDRKSNILNSRVFSNSERILKEYPKALQAQRELKAIYTNTVYNKYNKFLNFLKEKQVRHYKKEDSKDKEKDESWNEWKK